MTRKQGDVVAPRLRNALDSDVTRRACETPFVSHNLTQNRPKIVRLGHAFHHQNHTINEEIKAVTRDLFSVIFRVL